MYRGPIDSARGTLLSGIKETHGEGPEPPAVPGESATSAACQQEREEGEKHKASRFEMVSVSRGMPSSLFHLWKRDESMKENVRWGSVTDRTYRWETRLPCWSTTA